MFKNEEYSSFLNIFTKKFTILLIYKFYIPISTFRVSYKATTIFCFHFGHRSHDRARILDLIFL